MIKPKVCILDYGVGNHESIKSTIKSLGFNCFVSNKFADLKRSNLIILPGVGAFPIAMKNLTKNHLKEKLVALSESNHPILGICLGMQLLATSSDENGSTKGLNLIPGTVEAIPNNSYHIGWNDIKFNIKNFIGPKKYSVYFNHSFIFRTPEEYILCTSMISKRIVAGVKIRNTIGLQFHPEKSQEAGKEILGLIIKSLITKNE